VQSTIQNGRTVVTVNASAMFTKFVEVFHFIEMEWKVYLLMQTPEVLAAFL
jgi:hypothetical protein